MTKLNKNCLILIFLGLYLILAVLNCYISINFSVIFSLWILLILSGFLVANINDLKQLQKPQLDYKNLFYLSGIIVLIVFIRFFVYNKQAFGMYPADKELIDLILNQSINPPSDINLFTTSSSTSFFYLTTVYTSLVNFFLNLFGSPVDGILCSTILLFIFSTICCYFLFLQLSKDNIVALIGVFFFATASWGVIISISNLTNSIFLFLIILSFACFIRGIQANKLIWSSITGILLGLTIYVSLNAIYAFIIVVLFLIFHKKVKCDDNNTFAKQALLNIAGWGVLVIVPLILHLFISGKLNYLYLNFVNFTIVRDCIDVTSVNPLLNSIKLYCADLFFKKYELEPFAIPHSLLLDIILSSLFFLGLLWNIKNIKSEWNLFSLLWLFVGIIMCIFSKLNTNMLPDFYLASFIFPIIALYASVALINLIKPILDRPYSKHTVTYVLSSIIIAFLMINSYRVFYKYSNNISIYKKDPFSNEVIIIDNTNIKE